MPTFWRVFAVSRRAFFVRAGPFTHTLSPSCHHLYPVCVASRKSVTSQNLPYFRRPRVFLLVLLRVALPGPVVIDTCCNLKWPLVCLKRLRNVFWLRRLNPTVKAVNLPFCVRHVRSIATIGRFRVVVRPDIYLSISWGESLDCHVRFPRAYVCSITRHALALSCFVYFSTGVQTPAIGDVARE